MDTELQKELREYAWKYFSLHAEQRLKTFHFFVILATVLVGAISTIAKELGNLGHAAPLAYLLATLAFVFWKLDRRNKELIKHGENALKALERQLNIGSEGDGPHVAQLFVHEEWTTNNKMRFPRSPLLSAHMSYSDCFNVVFFVFGFGGFVVGCVFVWLAIG